MMGERPIVRKPENTFEWTIHEPFYKWRNEFKTDFSLHCYEYLQWHMSVVTWWQGLDQRIVSCTLSYNPTSHPRSITADVSASLTANGGAAVYIPRNHREFDSVQSYTFPACFEGVHRDIGTGFDNRLVISLIIDRQDIPRPTGVKAGHWGDLETLEKLSSDLDSMYEHGQNPTLILIGIDRAMVEASIDEQLKAYDPKSPQPGHSADNQKDSGHFSSLTTFPRTDEKETQFKGKLAEEDKKKDEEGWKKVVIDEEHEENLKEALKARDKALPSTKYRKFKVHHAILEKRWPTYFTDHKLAYRLVYDTWMYADILNEILHYVYSGKYSPEFKEFGPSEPKSELKEVLRETGLQSMYSRNQRSTKVCLQTTAVGLSKIFTVKLKIGTPNNVWRMPLPQFNDFETPCFEIKEGRFNRRPWLYYSISRMRTSCEVYIRLRDSTGRSIPVNIHDHAAKEDGHVESGPILYLGSQATFGDYLKRDELTLWFEVRYGHDQNGEIQRKFLDDVSMMDYGIPNPYPLMKLSNDMRDIMIDGNFTDTDVFSGRTDERRAYKLAHRAIITARVPESMVLIGYFDSRTKRMQLSWYLREDSYTNVLIFIYTGEMPFVDDDEHLREMHKFAVENNYHDLSSLIARQAEWHLLAF